MTRCPKCNNSTVVKITTQNKHKTTRGNMGILLWIIFFPFMLVWWFIRHFIIGGRDHEFHKESHWRCNYCAHTFNDKRDAELSTDVSKVNTSPDQSIPPDSVAQNSTPQDPTQPQLPQS